MDTTLNMKGLYNAIETGNVFATMGIIQELDYLIDYMESTTVIDFIIDLTAALSRTRLTPMETKVFVYTRMGYERDEIRQILGISLQNLSNLRGRITRKIQREFIKKGATL